MEIKFAYYSQVDSLPTSGRIDDDIDLNTDYAESDVMLGERAGTGTNSNGSNGNNGSEDRNSNNNSATVVASRY